MNKIILQNSYFNIEERSIDGLEDPYFIMNCTNAVICTVLDNKDNLLMVRQSRPAIGEETLEMPAGGIEVNESPKEAIERELKEEIQHECDLLYLGGDYTLMSSRINMKVFYFFGMNPFQIDNEAEEGLELERIPRLMLGEKIRSREFTQIGGIANLQLIGLYLNLDLLTATYKEIENAFRDAYVKDQKQKTNLIKKA